MEFSKLGPLDGRQTGILMSNCRTHNNFTKQPLTKFRKTEWLFSPGLKHGKKRFEKGLEWPDPC